ncbi:acetyl-coenzyme A transporter 1-like [Montipora foliosa]|uniref:acetyl-coenzyme A transporter 1-like n=1 Tax=Montipora foliosa TaxID=591990 RepID=UPI0035F16D11
MITRSRGAEAARKNEELARYDPQEKDQLIVDLTTKKRMANGRADEVKLMEENVKPNLKGDKGKIALLVFLYVLQGIPLGLAGAMPMLLQTRKIAYKDQATFSFVFWPFSTKLLWAPIVDTAYFSSFGRRKTWLVPVQYLIGIFMLVLSQHIEELMGEKTEEGPSILSLTAIFFCLNFLAATQDIAVDGWALTMLSRKNVGYASTCNSVGQTAGYFMGNVVFLALTSADLSNKYLRTEPQSTGVVTFSGFFYFWGIVFLVCTTLVGLFKSEKSEKELHGEEAVEGIVDGYKTLVKIMRRPSILKFIFVLLTIKIGFSAADSVTGLKMIEAGVPKENLALLAIPMVPIQILLPVYISRYTAGPRPLDVFIKAMPYRLFMGIVFMLCVWWANIVRGPGQEAYPIYFYATILLVYAVHQVSLYCMFVSVMAFHSRISDPRVGGTYLTLLNTAANFGGNWCQTLALWMVDGLTWTTCVGASITGNCSGKINAKACTDAGGVCETLIDGYYVESIICVVLGFLWLRWKGQKTRSLQDLPESVWKYQ